MMCAVNDEISRRLGQDHFVCNKINYEHDAIIEASAGTGKTYTLQSIVLKLLYENKIDSVKNILLVTYTEKAAGELKDRIRDVLEKAKCLPSDFDEVTICTIHSFCRSLLTEYAFENRVPMQVEIVGSDDDIVRRAVRSAILSDGFNARYESCYEAFMEAAGIKDTDTLADAVAGGLKDCASRGEAPKGGDAFDGIRREFGEALNKICPGGMYSSLWNQLKFNELPFHGSDEKKFREDFADFTRVAGHLASQDNDDSVFMKSLAQCIAIMNRGSNRLNPRLKNANSRRLRDHSDDYRILFDVIIKANDYKNQMAADLLCLAWKEYLHLKKESPVLTFDDLVNRACEIIAEESKLEKSELISSIRRKYRIALVDEFQDTDSKQWQIFKSIFSHKVNIVDGLKPKRGSLIVVGDPKQAIYSFRGADIGEYLNARSEIVSGDESSRHVLNTTFRSSPDLVKAFNRIFKSKAGDNPSWFEDMNEGGGSIEYSAVEPPPDSTGKFNGIEYAEAFGEAVELIESLPENVSRNSVGNGNKTVCLPVFLRNAAQEIKRLVSLDKVYSVRGAEGGREDKKFTYGDVCVLVHDHREGRKAQEILSAANVPSSIYKEQGVYASLEAETLLVLFDFISSPSSRGRFEALALSSLFGCRICELEARRRQENREFSKRIEAWQELVVKKEWNRFFESIMNDTLLAHPEKDDCNFDRSWAATRQILDRLLCEKGQSAQTVDEFAETLRRWRKEEKINTKDGELRRKESEADCVKIMTMHASKGLEFPVVFVAWGFDEMAGRADADNKDAAIRELKRLLYVALTRAEHKLYLPWSRAAKECSGIGSAKSALSRGGFLACGIIACFGGADAAARVVEGVAERTLSWRDGFGASVEGGASDGRHACDNAAEDVPVYEIDAEEALQRVIKNDSYTSLRQRASKFIVEPAGEEAGNDENYDNDILSIREASLLPRTNVSGDVFHKIMETLCNNDDSDGATPGFCTVGRSPFERLPENGCFMGLIAAVMRCHGITDRKDDCGDTTGRVLARMVWRALNVPIDIEGNVFCLKDVEYRDRRAEIEFVVNRAKIVQNDNPDDVFNGKIDLLVRPAAAGGKVYVIDWKTNSLPDFSQPSLERAMAAADYHLQYQFYSEAVRFWLGDCDFGGAAYLFVRAGERSESIDGDSGVYVAKSDAVSQTACREAIGKALM